MDNLERLQVSAEVLASGEKTGGNGLLRELVAQIKRYNLLLPHTVHQKNQNRHFVLDAKMVDLLDKIGLAMMAYLVYRPPGARRESGQRKWASVAALRPQLAAHEDFFQIRSMRTRFGGDGAGKDQPNYWLERLFTDQVAYDEGVPASTNAGNAETLSGAFDEWIGGREKIGFSDFALQYHAHASARPASESSMRYFLDLIRRAVEVERPAGVLKLHANDDPLDTTGRGDAAYSGLKNVFIYVCAARDQKVYSWESKQGEIHHSSFLGGAPVVAAGDWLVTNGTVRYLNADSGHYRPTAENMRMFAVTHATWWGPDTLIQPEHKGPVLRMRDFIAFGAKAKAAPVELVRQLVSLLGPGFVVR